MARDWSDAARAVWEGYPWPSPTAKAKAAEEAELVAFGATVEVEDLPLGVRQWLRRQKRVTAAARPVWHGESLRDAVAGFEKAILNEVLTAHRGNVAAAARALQTTRRIVDYKRRKYGLD